MADVMEGAVQQAPQSFRQFMRRMLNATALSRARAGVAS
jgi:hypothetical protein